MTPPPDPSPLTPEQMEKLAELATDAHKHEPDWTWDGRKVDPSDGWVSYPQGSNLGQTLVMLGDTYENYQVPMEFIAAANPQTVLALIAQSRRVAALEAERDAAFARGVAHEQNRVMTHVQYAGGSETGRLILAAKLSEAERQCERLQAENERLKDATRHMSHCSFSTGIDGGITAGRGRLNDNGYWEFPCVECERRANYHQTVLEQQLELTRAAEAALVTLRGEKEALLRQFAGYLSADVPELHQVEVPRLEKSVQGFLKAITPPASEEQG